MLSSSSSSGSLSLQPATYSQQHVVRASAVEALHELCKMSAAPALAKYVAPAPAQWVSHVAPAAAVQQAVELGALGRQVGARGVLHVLRVDGAGGGGAGEQDERC